MWKTGHSLIKAKLKETGAPLAGEMSGHIFFGERWYGFDDATYTAARLLEILSRSKDPSAVLNALPTSFSTPELNVPCAEGEHHRVVEKLREQARFDGASEVDHHRRPACRLPRRLRPGARLQHHAGAGAALRGRQPGGAAAHRGAVHGGAARGQARRADRDGGALKAWLARVAYSTLLRALTPAYLLRLWWRGRREPLYRHALRERLGFGYRGTAPGALWLHAVSLGETRAATALIDALARAAARAAPAADARHGHRARGRLERCCAMAMRNAGCPRTRRARCGASCSTTDRRWRADGNRDLAQPAARRACRGRADGAGQCAAEREEPAPGASASAR